MEVNYGLTETPCEIIYKFLKKNFHLLCQMPKMNPGDLSKTVSELRVEVQLIVQNPDQAFKPGFEVKNVTASELPDVSEKAPT